MPRTTLDLDASILNALRQRGKRERKNLGRVASELLARALHEPEGATRDSQFRWVTADLGIPRVDLEDTEALQDALNEPS